jgi:hypothetical protein
MSEPVKAPKGCIIDDQGNVRELAAVVVALRDVLRNGRGRSGGAVYMVNKDVWLRAKAALIAAEAARDA